LVLCFILLSVERLVFGSSGMGPGWLWLVLLGLVCVLGIAAWIVEGPLWLPKETPAGRPTQLSEPAPASGRNPHAWQDDQLAFRRRYAADPAAPEFGRTPILFRWWTRTDPAEDLHGIFLITWVVSFFVRLTRNTTPGTFVALYRPDAPEGAAPFLCFEVFDNAFGYIETGMGEGMLVGEAMRNGTLLLEADGRVVIPRWNPTVEIGDAPGR
jgi:hypothetical protein